MWSLKGKQRRVPITGERDRKVVYGAMNWRTGEVEVMKAERWNKEFFQDFLRKLRGRWRGWHIIAFLDRGSPHRARDRLRLAKEKGIELRWLPVACPELNPMEGIWRDTKGGVLANADSAPAAELADRACEYIKSLPPKERLRKGGILSGKFWLAT